MTTTQPGPAPAPRVLEGEIVDAAGLVFVDRSQLPALDFTDGLTGADAEVAAKLAGELKLAQMFARRALAATTMDGYQRHWAAFAVWCAQVGYTDPLDAGPAVVAAYLSQYAALVEDGEAVKDEEGNLVRGALRPATIGNHLSAINKGFELARLPKPGDSVEVKAVMGAIRRTFGVRAENAKAALDLPKLRAVLHTAARVPNDVLRDKVLVLLARREDTSLGQLARLDWNQHIRLDDCQVTISLPSATRAADGGATFTVQVRDDRELCLVSALHQLRHAHGGFGPVLLNLDAVRKTPDGGVRGRTRQSMTRQGLTKTVRRRLAAASVALPPTGLPEISDSDLRATIAQLHTPSTIGLRDQAMLSTGWFAALRRSNIVMLNWRDLTWESGDDGSTDIAVFLAKSKTDQEREGTTLWLPGGGAVDPDPVAALTAWRHRVAELIGGDPRELIPDQPVFVPIDRHGNLQRMVPCCATSAQCACKRKYKVGHATSGRLARLTGDAVNRVVQDLIGAMPGEQMRLDPRAFGAHSLRAGFVTEGCKDSKLTPKEIQDVTGHKSLDMIMRYDRAEKSKANNPARKLFIKLAG